MDFILENATHPQLQLHPSLRNISPRGRLPFPGSAPSPCQKVPSPPWGTPILPVGKFLLLPKGALPEECPISPLIRFLTLPKGAPPKESPPRSLQMHFIHVEERACASRAYRSLQMESMPIGELDAQMLLKVFHVSPGYSCFP
jgi:hypothetical protein